MKRQLIILAILLVVTVGAAVAAAATANERDNRLRGYVDPTQTADLPYRVPRLGVNADLTQYDDTALETQLELMRAANITWVRQFARWDEIEPTPDEYDWMAWDRIAAAFANDPQLELVVVFYGTPAWARDPRAADQAATPPANPITLANFAQQFAQRYGDVIDYYEIWDEPNLSASWGGLEPRAVDYLALLQASYAAVHAADADATVIAAALAPTVEQTNLNISDIAYFRELLLLGAGAFFDAAAAKPYGFDFAPDDRRVRADTLNFSRIIALRELLVEYGLGTKALWANAWGWNALPDTWEGDPSIWGQVSAQQRIEYTLTALERAEREWAWLGGMILMHWQPNVPADDPFWGFALIDSNDQPTPLYEALAARPAETAATNGLYFPANPYTRYSGVWTFSDLGADIGWIQDSRFAFDFHGDALALLLRRDNYLAFLYPTIDNAPANAAPRDASGSAYITLTSDTHEPETVLVPVTRGIGDAPHTLDVTADRGWNRWAIAGFAVSSGDLVAPYNRQIAVALVTFAVGLVAVIITATRIDWRTQGRPVGRVLSRLSDAAQLVISVITSLALMFGLLLTWQEATPNIFRREPVQLGLALVTAGIIYVQPHIILTVAALIALFVIVYHRIDLGLMLVVLYTPFFLFPVELYVFAFPMSELLLLVTFAAWVVRGFAAWGRIRQAVPLDEQPTIQQYASYLTPLDGLMAAWVVIGALSLMWTQYLDPAITELRTLILEPVLFYAIIRTTSRTRRDLLRLIDTLVIAGVLVALIGLWGYVRGDAIITAEEGARRLASVYGSPNNVGLFLGRCLPFALAFIFAAVDARRRAFAIVAVLVMGIAVILTQSAGALFVGVPAGVAALLLLRFGRRALVPLVGLGAVAALVLPVVLQSARFARLLDLSEGTNFFRIRVWQSAINIIRDYPLTGIGLDQFLYAFRGRYMLPDAWQEPDLSHPHQVLLDFWTRLGVLGVLWFAAVQVLFWLEGLRLYRVLRQGDPLLFALMIGTLASMVNLLTHGLIDNSVFVNDLSYVFILLIAVISNIRAIDAKGKIMV